MPTQPKLPWDVRPEYVDALVAAGAVVRDIRDQPEHDAGHNLGSVHVSRGDLEMNIEGVFADLDTPILCHCNAFVRGALSAAILRDMGCRHARFMAAGLRTNRKPG